MSRHLIGAARETYRARDIAPDWRSAFLFFYRQMNGERRPARFYFKSHPFVARWADWVSVQEIIHDDEYGFVRHVIGDLVSPTVVDLGANIGLFSLLVLTIRPAAVVHSVEASGSTYPLLEENRRLNPLFNWSTYCAAVWSSDGEVAFEDRLMSTSSRVCGTGAAAVRAISLATLFENHIRSGIDLLKIDIEGAEEAALDASAVSLKDVRNLIVEIHPRQCDEAAVMRTLRSAFQCVYRITGRSSSKPLILATRLPISVPNAQRL